MDCFFVSFFFDAFLIYFDLALINGSVIIGRLSFVKRAESCSTLYLSSYCGSKFSMIGYVISFLWIKTFAFNMKDFKISANNGTSWKKNYIRRRFFSISGITILTSSSATLPICFPSQITLIFIFLSVFLPKFLFFVFIYSIYVSIPT